jgi:hypothetical protein
MSILTVGSGQTFATVAAAVAASHDGDVIQVQAGTYTNDFAEITTKITIEGVGGPVHLLATVPPPNGKAILVTDTDVTLSNLEFSGVQVADGNGAGVRYQGGNLVINNCYFHDNQDGLLSGADPSGSITINNSEFAHNGTGDGLTHNLYVGDVGTLTIDSSYFHDAVVGHEIKSRAETTIIKNSEIVDGPVGTASYSVDLPNGGNATISNNLIEQGPQSRNPAIIHYGGEGTPYAASSLTISNNTILNDLASGSARAVLNQTSVTGSFADNQVFGLTAGEIATGPVSALGTIFLTTEPPIPVICFLPGTGIATPEGDVAVERLAVGDAVLTAGGRVERITWIGVGRVLATRGRRSAATPVIVKKGALADNVPHRDLLVTKGHSFYLESVLIPVEFLVNHRSILWDDHAQEVTLYHVELGSHDVLLANGAPAESYRDDGNRWLFRNGNSGWNSQPKPAFAPVLTGGPVVDAVWRRLLERAPKGPGVPLTDAPDLHLLVDGERLEGKALAGGVYQFELSSGVSQVRVVSRAGVQTELGLARDPRPLGVALRRIMLWRGAEVRVIEAADERLDDGFHSFEESNGFRWTNGDALLPGGLFDGLGGSFELELHVASTTHYPLFGVAA